MIDFICLGVPKCGTSSLYGVLGQHRSIVFPKSRKNAYFYGYEKKDWNKIESRYFPLKARKNKRYGIIAENWYGNVNPEKFARILPKDIKLIFIVRNPVDRCYSDYKYSPIWHGIQGTDEKEYYKYNHSKAFENYVRKYINDSGCKLLQAGKYFEKISRYYHEVNPDNIKVVFLEEIIKSREEVYNDLFHFIGLNGQKSINYDIKVNEGNRVPRNLLAGKIYGIIRTQFLQNTLEWKYGVWDRSENLYKLYCILLSKMELLLKYDEDESKMSKKIKIELENFYREDKQKFEKLLNKNLNDLWFK